LDIQAKNIHNKMFECMVQRQKCCKKLRNKKNLVNEKKMFSDQAHQRFLELRKKTEENRLKHSEIITKIKQIEKQRYKKQQNRIERTREELRKTAKNKLKEKKKLTFEEFKLLMEKGTL